MVTKKGRSLKSLKGGAAAALVRALGVALAVAAAGGAGCALPWQT